MKISALFLALVGFSFRVQADAVRLQIVGPDKKPLAGAMVRVLESSGNWSDRKTEPVRDFSSDEGGKVAFETKNALPKPIKTKPTEAENAPDEEEPMASPSMVSVRVMVPGMAMTSRLIRASDTEIGLQNGGSWGGVALDDKQQPVAGVKIVLSALISPVKNEADKEAARSDDFGGYFPKELEVEAVTGADGKWNFDSMPRQGSARIAVKDARYIRDQLTLPLDGGQAPPLFLERGAVIRGRLLAPDGTPAAGVVLHPGGSGSFSLDEDLKTAADGRFELPGLRAGDYYVQNIDFGGRGKKYPFIIEPKSVTGIQTGETRDIGDWKTELGILVKGKVVESGVKTPVANANISLWGRGNGQGQSDKNGEFSFRASDDASQSSVSASEFINQQKSVPAVVKGVLDLGTIELKRGLKVSGTLKNQDGKPVASRQIIAEGARSRSQQYGYVRNGQFTFGGLEPGAYTIKIEGMKITSDPKFSVAANQKTRLLEVVVEAVVAQTPRTLVGRALDGAGKPVAGARIALRITDDNRSYNEVTAISGVDGAFASQISMEGGTPKIVSATRPGLLFTSGEFKIVDGAWRGDLIFQERGAALRGRVVDSEGKAAPRVWVSLAGRNDQPIVQSDENGAFSLPDVALQGVTVVASNGRGYGEIAVAKAGDKPEVRLQKAENYEAAALADEILPNARLGDLWGERWKAAFEALGTPRMEAAILRAKTGNRGWDWKWNQYLQQLAQLDPASFLARGDELVAQSSTSNKEEATARLMLLRARSGEEPQIALARTWLGAQKAVKREVTSASVEPLLRIAAVADALKSGDAAFWLDYASQIAGQQVEKIRFSNASEWGGVAAQIGPRGVENLLQEWNAASQMKALGGALTTYVARKDLESARATLAQMEGLEPEATTQAAKGDVRAEESFPYKPKDNLAQSRGELADLLAQTDPKAAREMAKGVSEYQQTELMLEVGKSAARLGQNDLAAAALREVFEARYSNVEPGAAAAEIALGFDAKLAEELFAKAWQKSKPRRGDDEDFGYRPSIAAYAGARASKWAGESRILIEREWAERIKNYKAPTNNDYDSNSESLKALVGAMAKIDARRALEMAETLPGKDEAKSVARGQIALALLRKP